MTDNRYRRVPGPSQWEGVKGPNGRPLCKQCGKECEGRRTSYCSNECSEQWAIERWPSHQRTLVFKRDKGICAECGLDCDKLATEWYAGIPTAIALARKLGIPTPKVTRSRFGRVYSGGRVSFWDMDHKVAVIEGGGALGLENLQTLCIPDHRRKTAELARRRAEARRKGKSAA